MVANCDHLSGVRFSKALPYAFTEQGAIMAASVLNTGRAVNVSVFVVRAFVALRGAIVEHSDLAHKIVQLERRLVGHDEQILSLVRAIRELMAPEPEPRRRQIGFRRDQ